jgi:NitT/TauT family transport system permease protein
MGSAEGFKKIIGKLLPPAFWLGVWQVSAFLVEKKVESRGNELLLPYPATVFSALLRLSRTGGFWAAVLASLSRILLGLTAGVILGGALAVLTFRFSWADRLLSPAIRVVRATPVASFILLVLLWTGKNRVPVVIAALMVLPVVWANLSRGLGETDRKLLELARAYRFSRRKTVKLIYLPTLRPYFLSALTTSMGLAWKSGVAAEVLCLPKWAAGTEIYHSKLYLEIPDLFAWTMVVVALSLLLEYVLRRCLEPLKKGARP